MKVKSTSEALDHLWHPVSLSEVKESSELTYEADGNSPRPADTGGKEPWEEQLILRTSQSNDFVSHRVKWDIDLGASVLIPINL